MAGGTGQQQQRTISSGVIVRNHKRQVELKAVEIFHLEPAELWQLLSHPDGAPLFCVDHRRVIKSDGLGLREEEEVVFSAAVRVLWWKARAKTKVHQCVDASNPELLAVTFDLLTSDLMSQLTGSWVMQQLEPGPAGQPRTRMTYTFAMWPKGVPAGLRFMPGLLQAVKGAVEREAGQMFDKIGYVANKVRPGLPVTAALREVVGEVVRAGGSFKLLQQSKGRAPASLPSHVLTDVETSEDEEEATEEGCASTSSAPASTVGSMTDSALSDSSSDVDVVLDKDSPRASGSCSSAASDCGVCDSEDRGGIGGRGVLCRCESY